jgi:hypothetical protein
MKTLSLLPLSPPPEGYSAKFIYDSSTRQLPRTLLDTMMEAHIPPADAERLISLFNRVSFPIMRDDCFVGVLKDVVANTPPEQVEAKLKERLDTINSELDRQFKSVGDSVLPQVLYTVLSDSQRSDTIDLTGLRSLHDAKSFVIHTLPTMLEALKKEELTEANTDRERSMGNADGMSRKKPLTPPLSESLSSTPPSSRNPRRSPRIAQQTPTIPMKTQGVRKRRPGGRKKK